MSHGIVALPRIIGRSVVGKFSRNKGATAEREIANLLEGELGTGVKRRLGQARDCGHDLEGTEPFAVEVKRCEKIEMPKWWRQVDKAAAEAGLRPAVAYRTNGEPWRVRVDLSLEEFATIIREATK